MMLSLEKHNKLCTYVFLNLAKCVAVLHAYYVFGEAVAPVFLHTNRVHKNYKPRNE